MNRLDFMEQLESLLSDISSDEREEALQYYNDYLNDAGVENEQEVLDSLGTPEQLARVIKEGLGDNSQTGEFTEQGYRNESYEIPEQNEVAEKKPHNKKKKSFPTGIIVLIVILCMSPLLTTIASAVFGAGVGILGGILGLLVGAAAAGVALLIVGMVLIGVGIGALMSVPLAGICLIGAGILILGLSVFFIWLTVWECRVALPWLIRTVVNLCSRLFHKRGGIRE